MSDTYNYPAELERDEDGRYVVVFLDFGWGATDGATPEEALGEARDLLRELITTTMREGKALPEPSQTDEQRHLVVPPVAIALKAALYEAREAGMSQRRLAHDLERERSAADVESRSCDQGGNDRPRLTPVRVTVTVAKRPDPLVRLPPRDG